MIWNGNAQSRQLIVLIVVSLLAWIFIELADAVSDGDTHRFDQYILRSFGSLTYGADSRVPAWLTEVIRDVTALGGVAVLTFVVLAISGFLWLIGQRRSMVYLLLSVLIGLLISQMFKGFFERPRPDIIPHGSYVDTTSFPSGHSLMAAVVYLTLAVMLARGLERRAVKVYVTSIAILLVLAIGVSRIFLGVHWPSDVVAGWVVGTGWALLCGVLARWLQKRGVIEPEAEQSEVKR
ncbi:phosphatase PAP2 family protein [uncultured Aliiroseovarius sp.]|nr:phosphatase PAP2 family protein [uncultured Aliiroseovarius sp.]